MDVAPSATVRGCPEAPDGTGDLGASGAAWMGQPPDGRCDDAAPAGGGRPEQTPGRDRREQKLLLLMLTTACVVNLAVTGIGIAYLRLHLAQRQAPQPASLYGSLRALLLTGRESAPVSGSVPGKRARPARLRRLGRLATLSTLRPKLFQRPQGYIWA